MTCLPRESIVSLLASMRQVRRPRLLLRTARIGLAEYVRERDLRRVLRLPAPPAPGPGVVRQLLELEAAMEDRRLRAPHLVGDTWHAARHVEVLIALLAESRLMAEAVPIQPPAPPIARAAEPVPFVPRLAV